MTREDQGHHELRAIVSTIRASSATVLSRLRRAVRALAVRLLKMALRAARHPHIRRVVFDALPSPYAIAEGQERYAVSTRDKTISRVVYSDGSFEFDKFTKTLDLLKARGYRVKRLYDVGANIGTICIPAVKRSLVEECVAFEPEPTNYRTLVANVYLNALEDCIATNRIALGARRGEALRFELSEENLGDHRVRVNSGADLYNESQRQVIQVASDTFDALAPEADLESLIWIDVQGYEGYVLEGARKALALGVPLVIEVAPYLIERAGCAGALHDAVGRYSVFYDLSEVHPRPRPIAELDVLMSRMSGGDHTDVLLLADALA